MEDIAKGNIASVLNTTTTFLENCMSQGKNVSPFSHSKAGSKVTLFNGSSIESLVSVPENIVGIRSQCLVCDEGGKISRQMYALCKPFTALSSDYAVGQGLDTDLYPHQLPNQILMISSAEGVNSELYDDFKYCWEQMLLGRSDEFFAASIDYHFPLSPTTHGVSTPPLLSQSTLDNALAANPYKFRREYGNIFDCRTVNVPREGFEKISCELLGTLKASAHGNQQPSLNFEEGSTTILYGVHSSEWKRRTLYEVKI